MRQKHVNGWDDPRLPTLCGLRRRGVPPAAIREFCERIGVTKYDSLTDVALLEHCIRDDLNKTVPRAMAVLDPVRLVFDNPDELPATIQAANNPEDPAAGAREIPFEPELFIEREDFAEVPPPKYFRLAPGKSVRLRNAGFVTCTGFEKDAAGNITLIRGRFTPMNQPVKVKATIHWVPAQAARPVEVRLYDRLFTVPEPDADKNVDFMTHLNPDSLQTVQALAEPSLLAAQPGDRFQFERIGYFYAEPDSRPNAPVFNRTVTLKDSWKG